MFDDCVTVRHANLSQDLSTFVIPGLNLEGTPGLALNGGNHYIQITGCSLPVAYCAW